MILTRATLRAASLMDVLSAQPSATLRRAALVADFDELEATARLLHGSFLHAQEHHAGVVGRTSLRRIAGHPTLAELVVEVSAFLKEAA